MTPSPLLTALLIAVAPAAVRSADPAWPGTHWSRIAPANAALNAARLDQARDYALSGGGAGYITRHGRLVLAWGDPRQRYDLKSTTKSFGSIALALALTDGLVRLEDPARQYVPELGTPPAANATTGWLDQITLLHLASQTAGFEKPGGFTRLLFRPGTQWDYSDAGPNWLADCLTRAYRRDLDAVMFERVFAPLGITRNDLVWRRNQYRPPTLDGVERREFGAGILANVDAMARIGLLMLREGRWRERTVLARESVREAVRVPHGHDALPVLHPETYGAAARHYGLLWWNNADAALTGVPRDAYWSWGLYDSLILVIPSLDLVVARAGQSWPRTPGADHYAVLGPFFRPLVEAAQADTPNPGAASLPAAAPTAYPPSSVIAGIDWAPRDEIVRQAPGSDNWPLTWGDDGALYTAYGDGRGFAPFVPRKLSLGLARLRGGPRDFTAENLRAPTLEQEGDGARGRKASGLLMVDGVLYLWARNATNAQLAWSADRGAHWTWADWRFTSSFGCPTFLNFGPDYAGARDDFVYVYSPDADSAYVRADLMALARVPKDRLRDGEAYEFFAGMDATGTPGWTGTLDRRRAVFADPGRCYRSGVSYHPRARRYLWVQTLGSTDTRFAGGLAIYDAPEPWGPWTTAWAAESWDVGPGETASLPTAWMDRDQLTIHLVFSGDDSFSVRAGTLRLHPATAPRAP